MPGLRHIISRRPSQGRDKHGHAHHGSHEDWLEKLSIRMKPGNTVAKPDFRVLECIVGITAWTGNLSSHPSQEKLCERLETVQRRKMCRRSLNRHLNALERDGYIKRIRRHHRDPQLGMVLQSTVYVPIWRACMRIARQAKHLFQLMDVQLRRGGSRRVTETAQYLNRFFKSVILRLQTPVDKSRRE